LPEDFNGQITISIGYLEVDTTASDGLYKNIYDLEIYNEPDLEGTIIWYEVTLNPSETVTLEFEPYQTVFVEVPNDTTDTPSPGNDYFLFAAGNNSFNGGAGIDTVDFSEVTSGVSIWTDEGHAEISGNNSLILFEGIEIFVGSTHDDRLTVHTDSFEARLGEGNDYLFLGETASGSFYMQEGDDFIVGYGSNVFIYSGDGDDIIFSYSEMIIDGGGGNDTFHSFGGSDTFIFGMNDGNDTLIGFIPNYDQLIFQDQVINAMNNSEFEIVSSDNGTVLNLFDGGSIEFVGIAIEDVANIIDDVLLDF
jgi:Ca2+-binding RTX toxin-like protein